MSERTTISVNKQDVEEFYNLATEGTPSFVIFNAIINYLSNERFKVSAVKNRPKDVWETEIEVEPQ